MTTATAKRATVPAQKAKPTKAYKPIDLDKLTWYKDPTTNKGEWTSTVTTVGSYLVSMGVYVNGTFESSRIFTTEAQRTILKIGSASKKMKMMRHVLRGGPVPQVILTVKNGLLSPLDGLQRGDVHTIVAQALLALKMDPKTVLSPPASEAIKYVRDLGHDIVDLDTFLDQPMKVEVWRGLDIKEEDAKFGTWNLDQTPISTRHMTEIMHSDLRDKLKSWGILTQTEKEAKAVPLDAEGKPLPKPRKKKGEEDKPTPANEIVRSLSPVQVNLYAYLMASRVADKSAMLEERAAGHIHDQISKYTEATVMTDMQWFYHEFMPLMHKHYDSSDSPAGKQIKSESETFTVPFLAALGYARQTKHDGAKIQDWQDEMIELLSKETLDPLNLVSGDPDQVWTYVRENKTTLKGSAGQKDRKLTYYGWRDAVLNSRQPDWAIALRDAGNA